jgi:hypothetical protein
VVNKDGINRAPTADPDKMFNNPFENSNEEEKFDADFPENDFNGEFTDDPAFKSFDKFVKFVKVEEKLWDDKDDSAYSSESSDYGSDNDSVTSAIYNFEYGIKLKKRRRNLFGKEQYKKAKRATRSNEDRIVRSNFHKTPRNIKKLKKQIRNEDPEATVKQDTRISEPGFDRKISEFEDDLKKEEAATPKLRPKRESINSINSKYEPSESEIDELLEGMKDPFGKDLKIIERETKENSTYSDFKTYRLRSLIFKSNDDLRQELLAIQLIKRLKKIFDEANLSLYLRPYEIIITSNSSGFIETIMNSASIDSLKKGFPKDKNWTLCDFFEKRFEYTFEECQKNFVESLAGYSFL